MTTDERFEYPPPVLWLDTESISLRVQPGGGREGVLVLKNAGGGLLSGNVTSGAGCLTFSPRDFEGNLVRISYKLTPDVCRPGDRIRANALITSNGGEKSLPVQIDFTPPGLRTEENEDVTSLSEFADYAKKSPERAAAMFSSPEFRGFLTGVGEGRGTFYETVTEDPDRERAMDNFLVLSGLKSTNSLSMPEDSFVINLKPGDTRPVRGSIPLERTGWGYLDARVSAKRGVPWLRVPERVRASDFAGGNAVGLPFAVDPKEVKAAWDAERVAVGPLTAEIAVRRLPLLEAGLSREFYGMEDEGTIKIQNHTGSDLLVEIISSEAFVKFSGTKYLVGEKANIPFKIKFSAFAAARTVLRSQPFVEAAVDVSAGAGSARFKKRLIITAGEW